jgi:hypothetical protein
MHKTPTNQEHPPDGKPGLKSRSELILKREPKHKPRLKHDGKHDDKHDEMQAPHRHGPENEGLI